MARIVNVIYRPHLVSYKAYEETDYRCCTVCDYKVVIETDDGQLLTASVMDDSCLREFNIEEAIRKISDETQNQDFFYPFERCVGEKDFDSFVNGHIEEGEKAIEAFLRIVFNLRQTNHNITNSLREQLNRLATEINGLLNNKRYI
jgi:hypothetical protein